MSVEESFQRAVYETVEATLPEVLGDKVAGALRFYVDVKSALKRPERFFGVMTDLVGPRQAEALRERALSRLYERWGLRYSPTGKSIVDELDALVSQIKNQS